MRISICLFLVTFIFSSKINANIFKKYPATHKCTLSDRSEFKFPYHIYDGNQVSLIGLINLKAIDKSIIPKNSTYQPVSIKPTKYLNVKYGVVILQFNQNKKSSLGKYNELIPSLLVYKKDRITTLPDPISKPVLFAFKVLKLLKKKQFGLGLLMWDFHMDNMLPIKITKEMKNANAYLSNINYKMGDKKSLSISKNGNQIFSAAPDFSKRTVKFSIKKETKSKYVVTSDIWSQAVMKSSQIRLKRAAFKDKISFNHKLRFAGINWRRFLPLAWAEIKDYKIVNLSSEELPSFCELL